MLISNLFAIVIYIVVACRFCFGCEKFNVNRLKSCVYSCDINLYYNSYVLQSKPVKNLNGQFCQICGDTVGLAATGDVFVACDECAFPLCHPCYEYEIKNVSQLCPQCKTRYKTHKG